MYQHICYTLQYLPLTLSHTTTHYTPNIAARFMAVISRMPGQALPIVGDKGRTLEYPLPLLASDPGPRPGNLNSTDQPHGLGAESKGKTCPVVLWRIVILDS
jgi:hypothetical protein